MSSNRRKTVFLIVIIFCHAVHAMPLSVIHYRPEAGIFCHGFGQYGYPDTHSDLYLCRTGYVVAYNCHTKQPDYVAYRLTADSVKGHIKRQNDFHEDFSVPTHCRSTLNDYRHSGYDRGHLAPYASMDFDNASADESFLLSNMSPQKAGLNRQGWATLEAYVRTWAKRKRVLYVYTGPIFKKGNTRTLGKSRVAVPDAFFKVIYAPKQTQLLAFIMPNKRVNKMRVARYRVSLANIYQRTGIRFLAKKAVPRQRIGAMWWTGHARARHKHFMR